MDLRHVNKNDYVPFNVADYVDNPIALLRVKSHITQEQLAKIMNLSQAYINKIEQQKNIAPKLLDKVKEALKE